MNKRSDHEARLLAEAFHDDWSGGRVARWPRAAARLARRRRQLRRIGAAAAVAVLATAGAIVSRHLAEPAALSPSAAGSGARVASSAAAASPAYEIISDDQLLAELKDRPLLVVHEPQGARAFILPDRSE